MKWFRFEQDGKVGIGVEQQGTTYDVTGQVYTDSLLEVISREFEVDLDLDIAPAHTLCTGTKRHMCRQELRRSHQGDGYSGSGEIRLVHESTDIDRWSVRTNRTACGFDEATGL